MTCQQCRFDNPAGMRFCGQCGAPLARRCPQCGVEAPPEFRFCGQCGASLGASSAPVTSAPTASPAPTMPSAAASTPPRQSPTIATYTPKHLADKILKSRSALEGERRQVTVLFGDIAGFTTMAERMDPEEVHRVINRCFEIITAEVHRFEGTINQYTGDGIMALFGAPIAHEDSARRAVHAALGIQHALREAAKQFQAERGVTLQMRIGLNTGPVVVGRIGDDLRMDYTAVGDTTNLAARMQQIARPGSVLVSEATYPSIEGYFETLDLGEMQVKGHSPVRAWEVLRPRGSRSRLDAAAERGLTPLVGRDREVTTLLERFRDVKAGHGQVVFLVGDAGMGKSRLLLEFRRRLAETGEPVTWLEGQCVSFGQSIPFLPLVEQLRKNFGIEELDGEPEIIAKVEHGMRRMGQLDSHIPHIRYLLSVDPGDPAITAMEPQARRRKVFDAMRALSVRGAALHPLILVVEDLHWLDTSSEEYLTSLMDSVAGVPLMLLLTYRVGYTPPFGSRSFCTTITLQNLTGEETLAVARRILGTDQFPETVKAALMAKAEGVPLFVEEISKTLLDLGVLRREEGGLVVAKGLDALSVPDTMQGIIMARLDRLGDDGKRAVQLASVIGRRFLVRLLDRIGGMRERLDGLLAELTALEIIYEQGLLPEPAYIFKHAVIQDVAYNSLLKERRRELHRAVGDAIEELYADRLTEHYEELAHHYVNGEQWAKAFDYLVKSGDRAKDAFANQLALDFYAHALDIGGRVTPALAARRIVDVYQRRSRIWLLLTKCDEAIAESRRMLEVARAAGDRHAEGEALVDLALEHYMTFITENMPITRELALQALAIAEETADPPVLAKAKTYLAFLDQVEGNLITADQYLQESLTISQAKGLKESTVQNLTWLGAHAEWRGEFARAIDLTGQGMAASVEIHDGFFELMALAFRCLAEAGLGHYAEAIALIDDGLVKARDRNAPFFQGRFRNSLGWIYQELGDFRRAFECDRESAEVGLRIKNANVEVSATINLGFDYLNVGEPGKALDLLGETQTRVDKLAFGAHRWRWSIHTAVFLAEALRAAGEFDRALVQIEPALLQAERTGSMKYVGLCHLVRGELALQARQWDPAERDLREALAIGRRLGYPRLTWQAADALARTLGAWGRMGDAVEPARLVLDIIETTAAGAPDPSLRTSFVNWPRVQAAVEAAERLRRG